MRAPDLDEIECLVKLLTSCDTFDEVIRLTESGSSSNVDMLVGDIYGGDSTSSMHSPST